MDEQRSNIQYEHEEFLRKIAKKIRDRLVNEPVGRGRFEEQVESCKKKYEDYYDWLTSQHEAAKADPQLLDSHQGNSLKEKYVWEGAACYWREPDRNDTPDVTTWFFPHWTLHWPDRFGRETSLPFKGERLPNDQERLICYYVLLAIVHDNALAGPLTKPIYFRPYNQSGPYGFQEWANINLWRWLSVLRLYGGNHRHVTAKKIRDMLESALTSVRTDISRLKPAETEQKAALAKCRRVKPILCATSAVVIFLAALLTILHYMGWLDQKDKTKNPDKGPQSARTTAILSAAAELEQIANNLTL
jgi:hypothetical protein